MPDFFSPASVFPTTSLFSPASLFLLLNLVIGTIVITSRFTSNRKPEQEEERRPPLVRAPSLLYRVKSFNLSFRKNSPSDSDISSENGVYHLERSPSLLQRLKSVNFSSLYRSEPESEPEFGGGFEIEEPEAEITGESEVVVEHHVTRSKSEQRVAAAATERKEAETRMRKSASEKALTPEGEEEGERVELRRPQTARYEKTTSFGDKEVDAKADDFINRFKQQLKLQRLDSLLRYRDMLKGK